MLRSGGNAVDAALAAWAVQGLAEPEMTGLGGDMFILIYLAKTGEVKFINGTGFAPMAATVDFYKSKGGLPDEGPLSVSVPGAVGAVELAAQDLRHPAAVGDSRAGHRARRARLPGHRSARRRAAQQPREAAKVAVVAKDLVQRRPPARDGRARRAEGSRGDAARDRQERQRARSIRARSRRSSPPT